MVGAHFSPSAATKVIGKICSRALSPLQLRSDASSRSTGHCTSSPRMTSAINKQWPSRGRQRLCSCGGWLFLDGRSKDRRMANGWFLLAMAWQDWRQGRWRPLPPIMESTAQYSISGDESGLIVQQMQRARSDPDPAGVKTLIVVLMDRSPLFRSPT